MTNHLADIAYIVTDILKSDSRFVLDGAEFDLKKEVLKNESENLNTLERFTQLIYGKYYAINPSHTLKYHNSNDPVFAAETLDFTRNLSFHNLTIPRTDPGWSVESVLTNGQVKARKNNNSITLEFNQYEKANPTEQLTTGSSITRKMLKESTEMQTVFYYAFSEAHFLHTPKIMRFYWNMVPAAAAALLKEVSYHLNKHRVPYLFKCLNNPALYERRDGAVLYICKQYHHITNELLPVIYQKNAGSMVDDVPLFSLRLATGLGYADSPVSGDSFGMNRSRIIARGMIAATLKNTGKKEDYLQDIYFQFGRENIDPSEPYIVKDSQKVIKPFLA